MIEPTFEMQRHNALIYARRHLATHCRWRDFLNRGGELPHEKVGDLEHHLTAIKELDTICWVLRHATQAEETSVSKERWRWRVDENTSGDMSFFPIPDTVDAPDPPSDGDVVTLASHVGSLATENAALRASVGHLDSRIEELERELAELRAEEQLA